MLYNPGMRQLFISFSVPLSNGIAQGDTNCGIPDGMKFDQSFMLGLKKQIAATVSEKLGTAQDAPRVTGEVFIMAVIPLEDQPPRVRLPSASTWHPAVRTPKFRVLPDLPF